MKLNKMNTVKFNGTDIDRVKFNGSEMYSAWTYAQGAPPLILPESIGKPLKKLYMEGADGGTGDLNEETGKYDVPITVRGKNILNTYGFGARNFNSPTAARYLTNPYGTSISTTAPTKSLTVTQTKTGNSSTPWNYINGYFSMGLNDEIEDGKSYRLSCDIEIVNNPLDVKYIQVLVNGSNNSMANIFIKNGRGSCTFRYGTLKNFPDRKLLEFRNAGCSMVISNIMITKISDTDITYEPYQEKTDLTVSLDAPLHSGEGAYINAEIPTVKGTTIIEVNTSVPPAALKTYYKKAR